MILMRNQRQFRKWAAEGGFKYALNLTAKKAKEDGWDDDEWRRHKESVSNWFEAHSPKEYPCMAESVCVSCNYEESQPRYLYRADLLKFLSDMDAVKGSKQP